MLPLAVMRPIWLLECSVNQRAPSGPAVIPSRPGMPSWEVWTANSVMVPLAVMRPILLLWISVNQVAPSGPAVLAAGPPLGGGGGGFGGGSGGGGGPHGVVSL